MPGLSQQAYTRGKKVDLPSDAASNACARSVRASPGRRRRASRVLRVCSVARRGVFALPDPLMGVTLAVNRLRECSNSMNQLRIVCTNRFLGEVPVNDNA